MVIFMTDIEKCPICQNNNQCGNVARESQCWCINEIFPEDIFRMVSDDRACICKKCLNQYNK
ncbi:cysteine-rich CWC family protein [Litchfieldia alkalitelluris]|uniref:cysteine-rich CWC family protein n=1 Tax=Litchfieldia alkalitelluris TaxID=304268 RepID=UPI002E273E3F